MQCLQHIPACQRQRVGVAVAGGLLASAVLLLRSWRSRSVAAHTYRSWALQYKQTCKQRLTELEERLKQDEMDPARVEEITSLSLPELIQKLQSGEWKAREVLAAYQIKALQSHAKTNCLVEPFVEAESWADACDKAEDKSKPLHGVPVSIKEGIGHKGIIASKGLGKLCEAPMQADWHVFKMLLDLGAVPFVRTGVPQMQLSYEGSNPIFGNVTSHLDPTRIPGGSSSGEGALIGDGGSVLGIGTDIAGSVRAPAAFSGICALKAGYDRVGYGPAPRPSGQLILRSVWGPMVRDVDSLVLAMQAILSPGFYTYDRDIAPVCFKKQVYESKQPLRIGYHVDDGLYPASPASQRAVEEAKAALEKAGHTLVEWKPPAAHFMYSVLEQCFSADGGKLLRTALENEPVDATLWPGLVSRVCQSRWTVMLQSFLLKLSKKYTKLTWTSAVSKLDVFGWFNFSTAVALYRREVNEDIEKHGLDAVLSPAFVLPTPKYGNSDTLLRLCSYMAVYNVLDWPAGVVPVTTVTQQDIEQLKDYHTGDDIEDFVRKDMSDGVDLPVAVQIASRKWNEELVLRIMKEVQSGVSHRN